MMTIEERVKLAEQVLDHIDTREMMELGYYHVMIEYARTQTEIAALEQSAEICKQLGKIKQQLSYLPQIALAIERPY